LKSVLFVNREIEILVGGDFGSWRFWFVEISVGAILVDGDSGGWRFRQMDLADEIFRRIDDLGIS
jgi:hypothetical protein